MWNSAANEYEIHDGSTSAHTDVINSVGSLSFRDRIIRFGKNMPQSLKLIIDELMNYYTVVHHAQAFIHLERYTLLITTRLSHLIVSLAAPMGNMKRILCFERLPFDPAQEKRSVWGGLAKFVIFWTILVMKSQKTAEDSQNEENAKIILSLVCCAANTFGFLCRLSY